MDITKTPGSNIVLGIPWLQGKNLYTDWENDRIFFIRERESSKLYPVLASSEDLNIEMITIAEIQILAASKNVHIVWSQDMTFDPTETFYLPKQYEEFRELFKKKSNTTALSPHQP